MNYFNSLDKMYIGYTELDCVCVCVHVHMYAHTPLKVALNKLLLERQRSISTAMP